MVAMFGWIIPAPLAIPQIEISVLPIRHFPRTILGNRSVVIMASSASGIPSPVSPRISPGTAARIFFTGSGSPMTPVEFTKTRSSWIRSRSETARETARASRMPPAPVAALAMPLLVTIAWATPDLIFSMLTSTGAAWKRFVVNIPAALAGTSEKIRPRSLFPFSLIPAEMPFAVNP